MADNKNIGGVVISEDVIAKMVSTAALEVEGVAGVVPTTANIKGFFRKDKASKGVSITANEDQTNIDVYISVNSGSKVKEVCEQVQKNVKQTVQNLTGRPVSKVNVCLVDIAFPEAENAE